MSSTLIAPSSTYAARPAAARMDRVEATEASSENPAVAEKETARWFRMLTPPFVLSAIFWGAAFGTEIRWFIAPAMFFGVGALIFSMIYLSLTSDSNAEQRPATTE